MKESTKNTLKSQKTIGPLITNWSFESYNFTQVGARNELDESSSTKDYLNSNINSKFMSNNPFYYFKNLKNDVEKLKSDINKSNQEIKSLIYFSKKSRSIQPSKQANFQIRKHSCADHVSEEKLALRPPKFIKCPSTRPTSASKSSKQVSSISSTVSPSKVRTAWMSKFYDLHHFCSFVDVEDSLNL